VWAVVVAVEEEEEEEQKEQKEQGQGANAVEGKEDSEEWVMSSVWDTSANAMAGVEGRPLDEIRFVPLAPPPSNFISWRRARISVVEKRDTESSVGEQRAVSRNRVALVIANNEYGSLTKLPPLSKCENGGRGMRDALAERGFTVTLLVNKTAEEMKHAIQAFVQTVEECKPCVIRSFTSLGMGWSKMAAAICFLLTMHTPALTRAPRRRIMTRW
jgi:hypothetical protein